MENNTQTEENKIELPSVNEVTEVANISKGQKLSTPVAIVIAGFLIMIGILATSGISKSKVADQIEVKQPAENLTDTTVSLAPITLSDHLLGSVTTAEVAIVEFSDLECPYCKSFHKALHSAMTKYPGKIAWVYRHFPLDSLHPKARNEAKASECVASIGGNDAFWKYIDMIFTNTPSNNGLDEALLPVFASKIGIDKKAFASCLASDQFDATVEAQYQDGVNAGVLGTPHSIIILKDGTQIPIKGANTESLNKTLDSILSK
jgi:protein-disulfide isomerase